MDNDKILDYAIRDYCDGNINEGEFIARLRTIRDASDTVLTMINKWDAFKKTMEESL